MYRVIDKHANSILLYITVPPPPRKALRSKQAGATDTEGILPNIVMCVCVVLLVGVDCGESDVDRPPDTQGTASSDEATQVQTKVVTDDEDRPLQKSIPNYVVSCDIDLCITSLAIEIRIDRRCTLAELKAKLEDYVRIPSSEFKVQVLMLQ